MNSRLSLLLLVLLVACHKDDAEPEDPLADPWIYANLFIKDAATKGVIIQDQNVTLQYVDAHVIAPRAAAGSASQLVETASITVTKVLIRIAKSLWDTYTPAQKEITMYREFARAVLKRNQADEMLPNCVNYKSMMSETDPVSAYPTQDSPMRKYYIDELFNPYTPYPSWGGSVPPNKTTITLDMSKATYGVSNGSAHTGDVDDDGIMHVNGAVRGEGSGYWAVPIPSVDIPVGSTIVAKFNVRAVTLFSSGGFVEFAPALDDHDNRNFFTSTFLYELLPTNMLEYRSYTLTLNCYPAGKPDMVLYMGLNGASTGDVWFKDVEVSYYHN